MHLTEATHAWIYRTLTPLSALLISYGVVNEQKAALWVALGGSVLGFGLASANTSTKPQ